MRLDVTRGMRIRLLRTARRIDTGELAARSKVSAATIGNIEHDRFGGRDATLDALASTMEVSRDALDDDSACMRELARVLGVEMPAAEPSLPSRVAELLRLAGPERAAYVIQLLEAQVRLMLSVPPPATVEEPPKKR